MGSGVAGGSTSIISLRTRQSPTGHCWALPPHKGNAIIIIVSRFCSDCLHGCRKSLIIGGTSRGYAWSCSKRLSCRKGAAHGFYGSSSLQLPDKGKMFSGSYFFRRTTKKPRVSCNILLIRFNSVFSFSSSRVCYSVSF